MGRKFENFSDGVSVLYIIGLGAKVRPPAFDSWWCLGRTMVDWS